MRSTTLPGERPFAVFLLLVSLICVVVGCSTVAISEPDVYEFVGSGRACGMTVNGDLPPKPWRLLEEADKAGRIVNYHHGFPGHTGDPGQEFDIRGGRGKPVAFIDANSRGTKKPWLIQSVWMVLPTGFVWDESRGRKPRLTSLLGAFRAKAMGHSDVPVPWNYNVMHIYTTDRPGYTVAIKQGETAWFAIIHARDEKTWRGYLRPFAGMAEHVALNFRGGSHQQVVIDAGVFRGALPEFAGEVLDQLEQSIAVLNRATEASAAEWHRGFDGRWKQARGIEDRCKLIIELRAQRANFLDPFAMPLPSLGEWGKPEADELVAAATAAKAALASGHVAESRVLDWIIAGEWEGHVLLPVARLIDAIPTAASIAALDKAWAARLAGEGLQDKPHWSTLHNEVLLPRMSELARQLVSATPDSQASLRSLLQAVADGNPLAWSFREVAASVDALDSLDRVSVMLHKGDADAKANPALAPLWPGMRKALTERAAALAQQRASHAATGPAERALLVGVDAASVPWLALLAWAREIDTAKDAHQLCALAEAGVVSRSKSSPGLGPAFDIVRKALAEGLAARARKLAATAKGSAQRTAFEEVALASGAGHIPTAAQWDALRAAAERIDAASDSPEHRMHAVRELPASLSAFEAGRQFVARARQDAVNELAASVELHVKAGRIATAVVGYLQLHAEDNARWPEPVTVLDFQAVVAERWPANPTFADRARKLLLPLIARFVPALPSTAPMIDLQNRYLAEGPYAEWPIAWHAGLHLGEVGKFWSFAMIERGRMPDRLGLIQLGGEENAFAWVAGKGDRSAEIARGLTALGGDQTLRDEYDRLGKEQEWLHTELEAINNSGAAGKKAAAEFLAAANALKARAEAGEMTQAEFDRARADLKAQGMAVEGVGADIKQRIAAYSDRSEKFHKDKAAYNDRVFRVVGQQSEATQLVLRGALQRTIRDRVAAWEAEFSKQRVDGADGEVAWMRWLFGVGDPATRLDGAAASIGNLTQRVTLRRMEAEEATGATGVSKAYQRWWRAVMDNPAETPATREQKAGEFVTRYLAIFTADQFFGQVLMKWDADLIEPLRAALPPAAQARIKEIAQKIMEDYNRQMREKTGGGNR
ncbi:MAG: hypothetical protein AB7K09_21835 [Planctomycetota bacterium]